MNTYPRDIVTGLGVGRIHKGHGLDPKMLEADLESECDMQRIGERLLISEERLAYRPRIKWCERLDGFGCEENGEWHGHWEPVRENGELFTVVQWASDEVPR